MPLDPTISLQGVYTNPNAMVQQSGIALQRQQMQQAQQMQPYKIQQMQAEAAGTQADTQKKQLDTTIAKANRIGDLLGSVDSSRPAGDPVAQGQWNSAIQQAKSEGFDVSKFEGTPYDPNKVNQVRQQTMGVLNSATLQSKQLIMRANFQRQLLNTVGDTDKVQQIMSLWDMNNAPAYGGITQQSPAQAPTSNNGLTGPAALPATPPATSTAGQPMPSTAAVTGAMNATPNAAIPPANAAPANAPPAFPPPQGSAQTGQPMSSLPAQQASAMPVAATAQQPTSAQIASMPTNQTPVRPNITTIKGQGGVVGIKAKQIMADNPTISVTDAYSLAQRIPVGMTVKNGQMVPFSGALQATSAMENAKETGKQNAEIAAAGPKEENSAAGKETVKYSSELAADAGQSQNMINTLSALEQAHQQFTSGQYAPMQQTMLRLARAMDVPLSDKQISELTNEQVFNKLSMDIVGASAKAEGGASRLNAAFSAIKESNPTIGMEPESFETLKSFLGSVANKNIAEQGAWSAAKNADKNLDSTTFQRNYAAKISAQQQQNGGKLQPYDFGQNAAPAQAPAIDPRAIQMLKANPNSGAQFDQIFGAGAAAKALAQ